uniref:Uncharacterized protein n=1 Tax=Culex nigripalpus nucleopolyhedrovirus TaxID=130556 RepID=Q99GR2_NPVCN|nr:unknown [Culex nigripalpus nucleopolyhedrovirus]
MLVASYPREVLREQIIRAASAHNLVLLSCDPDLVNECTNLLVDLKLFSTIVDARRLHETWMVLVNNVSQCWYHYTGDFGTAIRQLNHVTVNGPVVLLLDIKNQRDLAKILLEHYWEARMVVLHRTGQACNLGHCVNVDLKSGQCVRFGGGLSVINAPHRANVVMKNVIKYNNTC